MTETKSNVEKANYSGEKKNNLTKINTSNKKHFRASRLKEQEHSEKVPSSTFVKPNSTLSEENV